LFVVVPCSGSEFSGGNSSLMDWHSDGGNPKPAKSLLGRGFLNPMMPVVLGASKETSGMTPSPSAPRGFSMPEDSLVHGVVGLQAFDLRPLSVLNLNSKPLQRYNRKSRDNRFLKMDDSLIAESVLSFSALPVVVHYPSSEVDSEVEDFVCWDGDDERFFLHCHMLGLGLDGFDEGVV
jgi:hypothetical protein